MLQMASVYDSMSYFFFFVIARVLDNIRNRLHHHIAWHVEHESDAECPKSGESTPFLGLFFTWKILPAGEPQ